MVMLANRFFATSKDYDKESGNFGFLTQVLT